MVYGVHGKMMVNVLKHVMEEFRDKHVPVLVLLHHVMEMSVVVMPTKRFHAMNSAVQVIIKQLEITF